MLRTPLTWPAWRYAPSEQPPGYLSVLVNTADGAAVLGPGWYRTPTEAKAAGGNAEPEPAPAPKRRKGR